MLGAIIGDIAGSSYEVEEINSIRNKKIDYNNRMSILNSNKSLFNNNSSYTDDTILTAAIAKSILTNRDYFKNLKEFGLREVNLGLDKYGRNKFSSGFCDWLNGNYIGSSYGNGCAMRISPIANYFNDLSEIIKETKKATKPSHNHVESYTAAEMVSCCIYLSNQGKSKKFIKNYIENLYECDLNFDLECLQKNYKFTSKAKNSVPQAIYCFLVSNDFEDSIRKAISIGGDSDTIAAITGSIAEAYYGIDDNLIKEVEKYLPEYIINIVNEFYSKIKNIKPFKNQVKDFFKAQNLYSEEFFDFLKGKIKELPSNVSIEWFGCFPIVEEGILKDIRLLVPEIKTQENLLVNIHEFSHALELFNELGTIYEEKREQRENFARNLEKVYKKSIECEMHP